MKAYIWLLILLCAIFLYGCSTTDSDLEAWARDPSRNHKLVDFIGSDNDGPDHGALVTEAVSISVTYNLNEVLQGIERICLDSIENSLGRRILAVFVKQSHPFSEKAFPEFVERSLATRQQATFRLCARMFQIYPEEVRTRALRAYIEASRRKAVDLSRLQRQIMIYLYGATEIASFDRVVLTRLDTLVLTRRWNAGLDLAYLSSVVGLKLEGRASHVLDSLTKLRSLDSLATELAGEITNDSLSVETATSEMRSLTDGLEEVAFTTFEAFMVAQMSPQVYEVALPEYGYYGKMPSSRHAVLVTTATRFTSKGWLSLPARKGSAVDVNLKEEFGGFTQNWPVYVEVDRTPYLAKKTEISRTRDTIAELKMKIIQSRMQLSAMRTELEGRMRDLRLAISQ